MRLKYSYFCAVISDLKYCACYYSLTPASTIYYPLFHYVWFTSYCCTMFIIHVWAADSKAPHAEVEFVSLVLEKRRLLGFTSTNEGELAAFISYAQAFPKGLLALVDTYDTVQRYVRTSSLLWQWCTTVCCICGLLFSFFIYLFISSYLFLFLLIEWFQYSSLSLH